DPDGAVDGAVLTLVRTAIALVAHASGTNLGRAGQPDLGIQVNVAEDHPRPDVGRPRHVAVELVHDADWCPAGEEGKRRPEEGTVEDAGRPRIRKPRAVLRARSIAPTQAHRDLCVGGDGEAV